MIPTHFTVDELVIPIVDGRRDEDKKYRFNSVPPQPIEGEIYQVYERMRKEYGRCSSKVYIDTKDKKAKPIGWVFEKKTKYDDSDDFFIKETWIALYFKCAHCGGGGFIACGV